MSASTAPAAATGAASTAPTSTNTAQTSTPGATASVSSPAGTASSPIAAAAAASTSSPSAAPPATTAASPSPIAVAFYAQDPQSKHYRLRPSACSSSSSPSSKDIIASSPETATSSHTHGVVSAFNAATDLVMYLDEQLVRPPSMGETVTGLFRPASKELEGRLKKLGERVEGGKLEVPVGKGGEKWEGKRRVVRMEWEEFGRVFGTS